MAFGAYMEAKLVMLEVATQNEASFTLFYKLQTGPEPVAGDIEQFANDFMTAYTSAMTDASTTAHHFNRVELIWRDGSSVYVDGISTVASVQCSASGDVLPEQNCVVVQRRTGQPGRNKRGRVFIPFVPESYANGSSLSVTGHGAYQAIAGMIASNVTAGPDDSVFIPVTKNYKTATLENVVQGRFLTEIGTRDDRKFIKRGRPVVGA